SSLLRSSNSLRSFMCATSVSLFYTSSSIPSFTKLHLNKIHPCTSLFDHFDICDQADRRSAEQNDPHRYSRSFVHPGKRGEYGTEQQGQHAQHGTGTPCSVPLFGHPEGECTGDRHPHRGHIDENQYDDGSERPFNDRHDEQDEGGADRNDDSSPQQLFLVDDSTEASDDETADDDGDAVDAKQYAEGLRRDPIDPLIDERCT